MDNTADRAKLAKAMGWKHEGRLSEMSRPGREPVFDYQWCHPDGHWHSNPPDPSQTLTTPAICSGT